MAHSLATATGTRVDSASKHIVPCRVATDFLTSHISSSYADNPGRELQINKYKYCMAKDDLVLGLGRPMYGTSVHANRKKAYPSVITTLAQMEGEARKWIAVHNFMCRSYTEANQMKRRFVELLCSDNPQQIKEGRDQHLWDAVAIKDDRRKAVRFQIENMIDFYVVGIALGTAWAHPSSGDTVASVMIGGLKTVQNGAFPVHTNDLLCVYFDDERDFFEDNGGRKDRAVLYDVEEEDDDDDADDDDVAAPPAMSMLKVTEWVRHGKLESRVVASAPRGQDRLREMYAARENGAYPATASDGKHSGKVHVARIKPYMVSRHVDKDTRAPQHFPADKARIFAKAISNAMPFEKLDIMISRQSL